MPTMQQPVQMVHQPAPVQMMQPPVQMVHQPAPLVSAPSMIAYQNQKTGSFHDNDPSKKPAAAAKKPAAKPKYDAEPAPAPAKKPSKKPSSTKKKKKGICG